MKVKCEGNSVKFKTRKKRQCLVRHIQKENASRMSVHGISYEKTAPHLLNNEAFKQIDSELRKQYRQYVEGGKHIRQSTINPTSDRDIALNNKSRGGLSIHFSLQTVISRAHKVGRLS